MYMDKRKFNKGVKGNKGGRRPTLANEEIRAAVIDKSWSILLEVLDNPEIDLKERRQIALEIAKKTIPQNIEGDLRGSFTIKWATE